MQLLSFLLVLCLPQYPRALLVLKQCAQLDQGNALVPLYAAKLCFNNLHMVSRPTNGLIE